MLLVQYRYSSIILQFIDVLPKERMYYAQMQLYWYCTRGEKQRTLSIQLSLHGMDTQDTLQNTQDLRSLRCIASNQ